MRVRRTGSPGTASRSVTGFLHLQIPALSTKLSRIMSGTDAGGSPLRRPSQSVTARGPMRLSQWLSTVCLVLVVLLTSGQASAQQWAPIDPADLTLKAPRVDPAADAEVLLWEVRVTDDTELDDLNTAFNHYIRIKVFNDRGRESEGKVELPFTN